MATGIVWYWNGISGWIKQSGVEEEPTALARDVMILQSDVISGEVVRDCAVTFEIDQGNDPWLAREATVT